MYSNAFQVEGYSQFRYTHYSFPSNPSPKPSTCDASEDFQMVASAMADFHVKLNREGVLNAVDMKYQINGQPAPSLWLFRHPGATGGHTVTPDGFSTIEEGELELSDQSSHLTELLLQALLLKFHQEFKCFGFRSFGNCMVQTVPAGTGPVFLQKRKVLPAVELQLLASNASITVHAHCSYRRFRPLNLTDSECLDVGCEVIISPGGQRGKLLGKCSKDYVNLIQKKDHTIRGEFKICDHCKYVEVQLLPACQTSGKSSLPPNLPIWILPSDRVLVPIPSSPSPRSYLPRMDHVTFSDFLQREWTSEELPEMDALGLGWPGFSSVDGKEVDKELDAEDSEDSSSSDDSRSKSVDSDDESPVSTNLEGATARVKRQKLASPKCGDSSGKIESISPDFEDSLFQYDTEDIFEYSFGDDENVVIDETCQFIGEDMLGRISDALLRQFQPRDLATHVLREKLRHSRARANVDRLKLAHKAEAAFLQGSALYSVRQWPLVSCCVANYSPAEANLAKIEGSREPEVKLGNSAAAGKPAGSRALSDDKFMSKGAILATDLETVTHGLVTDTCESRFLLCSCLSQKKAPVEDTGSHRKSIPSRILGDETEEGAWNVPDVPLGVWTSVTPLSKTPDSTSAALDKKQNESKLEGLCGLLSGFADVALDSAFDALDEGRCLRCGFFQSASTAEEAVQSVIVRRPLICEMSATAAAIMLHTEILPALKATFTAGTVRGPLSMREYCSSSASSPPAAKSDDEDDLYSDILAPSPAGSAMPTEQSADEVHSQDDDPAMSPSQQSNDNLNPGSVSEQQQGRDYFPADSMVRDFGVALPSPAVMVGYQGDWLVTSPAVFDSWGKAELQPFSRPKNVSFYVLCPNLLEIQEEVRALFREISSAYESCNLGSHVPGNRVSGLTSSDSSGIVPIRSNTDHHGYKMAVMSTLKSLATVQSPRDEYLTDPEADPFPVVYIVCPWSQPVAHIDLLADIYIRPNGRNQGSHGRFTVHLIPAATVLSMASEARPSAFRGLAMDLYSKLRRSLVPLPEIRNPVALSEAVKGYSLYEAPFILSEPGQSALRIGTESPKLLEELPAVHCCYTWLTCGQGGEKQADLYLISVWTDARGELLDTRLVQVAEGEYLTAFQEIVEFGLRILQLAASGSEEREEASRRSLVIMRIGAMPGSEQTAWRRALATFPLDGIQFVDRLATSLSSLSMLDNISNVTVNLSSFDQSDSFRDQWSPIPASPEPGPYRSKHSPLLASLSGISVGWMADHPSLQILTEERLQEGEHSFFSWAASSMENSLAFSPASSAIRDIVPHPVALATLAPSRRLVSATMGEELPCEGTESCLYVAMVARCEPEASSPLGIGTPSMGSDGGQGRAFALAVLADLHGLMWVGPHLYGGRNSRGMEFNPWPLHARLAVRLRGLLWHAHSM